MKTYIAREKEIEKKWYVVDAKGKTLGRLASRISHFLQGKHKSIYTPNIDTGDYIIVINARYVVLTKDKAKKKIYYHHSLYPGGLKSQTFSELIKKNPSKVIELAVKNMLPDSKLGKAMLKKIKVYPEDSHPHQSQKPEILDL